MVKVVKEVGAVNVAGVVRLGGNLDTYLRCSILLSGKNDTGRNKLLHVIMNS